MYLTELEGPLNVFTLSNFYESLKIVELYLHETDCMVKKRTALEKVSNVVDSQL